MKYDTGARLSENVIMFIVSDNNIRLKNIEYIN